MNQRDAESGSAPGRACAALTAGIWAILVLIVVYYALGTWAYYPRRRRSRLPAAAPIAGGSRVVDMAAALIERETVTHAWQPNDPVFMPNGLLIHPVRVPDRHAGCPRPLLDRARGPDRPHPRLLGRRPGLGRARGLLNFPPDIWFFDFGKSLLPTITSEQNYRAGREALLAYNQRVAAKGAMFDVRTDSLAPRSSGSRSISARSRR